MTATPAPKDAVRAAFDKAADNYDAVASVQRAACDRLLALVAAQGFAAQRILDAGCGTGAFAMAAARRGAEVVAIDLSPSLVEVAVRRVSEHLETFTSGGRIDFRSGDFTDPALGTFDHVVAMDSLIHYRGSDAMAVLQAWAERTRGSMCFTFAPSNPLLLAMHAVGRIFPRGDRAPAIEPVAESALRHMLATDDGLARWQVGRTERVKSGFYTSQAIELKAAPAAAASGGTAPGAGAR